MTEADIVAAKVAILTASLLAGVVGFLFLFLQAKRAADKGQTFQPHIPEGSNLQTHDVHEAERRARREGKPVTRRQRSEAAEETVEAMAMDEERRRLLQNR